MACPFFVAAKMAALRAFQSALFYLTCFLLSIGVTELLYTGALLLLVICLVECHS